MPLEDFSYGEDNVTARLAFDLPSDLPDTMNQIVGLQRELTTSLEATARFAGLYVDYISSVPDIQREINELTGQLTGIISANADATERMANAQDRIRGGAGVSAGGGGGAPPQGGGVVIMGGGRNVGEGQSGSDSYEMQGGGSPDEGQGSPRRQQKAQPQEEQGGIRSFGNALARNAYMLSYSLGGGNTNASDIGYGLTNWLMNMDMMTAGRGQGGLPVGAVSGTFNPATGKIEGEKGSKATHYVVPSSLKGFPHIVRHVGEQGQIGKVDLGATIAGMSESVVPILGAASVGMMAYGKVAEVANNMHQMGVVTGQGASKGLSYEMGIQQMALNPFIGSEQARQIVMSALSAGYSGKEFDTVTGFMAENLSKMNMSVADSVGLLNTNVQQGGQSIASLATQLNVLKNLAPSSNQGLPSMTQQFAQVSGTGTALGASGSQSGEMGLIAANMFQGRINGSPNPLAGLGGQISSALLTSPMMQAQLARQHPGNFPQAMPGVLGQNYLSEAMKVIAPQMRQDALEAQSKDPAVAQEGVIQAMDTASAYGLNLNWDQAAYLMKQFGTPTHPTDPASVSAANVRRTAVPPKPAPRPGIFGKIGSDISGFTHAFGDILGALPGVVANPRSADKTVFGSLATVGQDRMTEIMNEQAHDPALESLGKQYGYSNIMVQDPKTKKLTPLTNYINAGNMSMPELRAINSGKSQIAISGVGGAQPLSLWAQGLTNQTPGAFSAGQGATTMNATGNIQGGGSGQVAVMIDVVPGVASKLIQVVGGNTKYATVNGVQSTTGYNGVQLNNGAPGLG